MLDLKRMIVSAHECIGWPYESPGNNNSSGIDCSGMFVKMYRDQGANIYHGSNTIFREHCSETGEIHSEKDLKLGMAVFKWKPWTDADKNNKWYGTAPGNLSHIGFVTGVNPLEITHCTSPVAKTDSKIGKWAYWGKLKDVDYGESSDPAPVPVPVPEPVPEPGRIMYVFAENGEPVNFRTGPSTRKARIDKIPVGGQLTVYGSQGEWSKAKWNGRTGWIMSKFLTDQEQTAPVNPEPAPEPDPDPIAPGTSATVWSENGKPVKLRNRPSTGSSLYDLIPINTVVTLDKYGDNWCKVSYGYRRGWYIMTKYLTWG